MISERKPEVDGISNSANICILWTINRASALSLVRNWFYLMSFIIFSIFDDILKYIMIWIQESEYQRLVCVNRPPNMLPVLTKDGIVWPNSNFFNSVCSENFYALKLPLYLSLIFFDWIATLRLILTLPELIVLNIYLLMGPGWSSSFIFSDLEISYKFLVLMSPPRKN